MNRYISDELRHAVATRAGFCCEYCGLRQEIAFLGFQVDHIISLKHGGGTELSNLAWTCYPCNIYKGSDLGTVFLPEKVFVRLLIDVVIDGKSILKPLKELFKQDP